MNYNEALISVDHYNKRVKQLSAKTNISEGWCPFMNAAAKDGVGTCCHLAEHGKLLI